MRRTATPSEAILAVSRLLGDTAGSATPDGVRDALVREARELFGVERALLLAADDDRAKENPAVRDLLALRLSAAHGSLGDKSALFVPVRERNVVAHVLALVDAPDRTFSPAEQELAGAFAAAAAGALAQVTLAEEHSRRTAQQSALTRAAKTLNESLDLPSLLTSICAESQAILEADAAAIYLGNSRDGLVAEAVHSLGREVLGYLFPPGKGLAGKVAQTGRSMLTNDYQGEVEPPPDSPFGEVRSSLAVPMVWNGELRGVLSVGYKRDVTVGPDELSVLEAFAELAAAACRNASAATGLALAARTDALTGCLNHAALQDGLRRELDRSARSAQNLSLVLIDLDGFKQVNEEHGHLVGDEVLRRVGHALRSGVRPYDLCARYGGDEFAIVCADTDEGDAAEIATRAIERIALTLSELEGASGTGATAGVSRWIPGQGGTEVLEEADRALLWGKQQERRGEVIRASAIPPGFRPARFRRAEAAAVLHSGGLDELTAPDALHAQRQAERLQKRTRQLVLANALGARLAGMNEEQAIVDAAVDELHRAFGYYLCAIVRLRDDGFVEGMSVRGGPFARPAEQAWSQPRHAGVIGRALRERRVVTVNDVTEEPDYRSTAETSEVKAELVAPIWIAGRVWGAVNIEENHVGAFDDDDARLVQTVADQVGAALRSAQLYAQLERAYLGTAEALAAALEAKDAMLGHSASIVGWCEAVGARLGMGDADLRDLRYGAALHDIGKIAIPEAILEKPGPLDEHEREVMQRHPVVGEQILAPVEFLAGVGPLIRHEHERWDGSGYPDGLAGPAIPLGARIIFACDAYHAMISDRPYRVALSPASARAELEANAGTQFDPGVVTALLAELESAADSIAADGPPPTGGARRR